MTKLDNFRIKVLFEERVILNKKADKVEDLGPIFKDLKKKFS